MYKAVLFDFDYTLGDSTDGIVQCENYALRELGYPEKSVPEIKKTIGLSLKEIFRELTGSGDESKSEQFIKLFRKKADEVMTDSASLYDGAEEMLSEFKRRGIKTGIVTTKFHYRITEILEKFGVSEAVDVIIGGDDVIHEKPAPDSLLKAVEILGADKRDVLYVGDSFVDAQAARAAGIDFAAVLTGTTDDFSDYDKVFVANDLQDIFRFVTKI